MRRDAFEHVIRAHQAELYRYLRYLGADAHAAEDLVQETFLAAHGNPRLGRLVGDRAQAAYLRGMARNLYLLSRRRDAARPAEVSRADLDQAEAVWQNEFLREGDGFDYVEALRRCLAALEAGHRRFLHRHYAENRTRAELARELDMAVEGVKTLARRLRARLADCIRRRLRLPEAEA